jgi:NAD(P)-dependent dehydrogenase (short-subunit alcohol dehydrogenase family)
VVNLTRALALDLGRKGIRVNAVCPSLTRTGMTEDMMDDKKLLAKFSERIPLGRVCESEEVAAVIAFLASVAVDGGRIRLQWTTAARIAAQRRSSTYFASAVSSKRA